MTIPWQWISTGTTVLSGLPQAALRKQMMADISEYIVNDRRSRSSAHCPLRSSLDERGLLLLEW